MSFKKHTDTHTHTQETEREKQTEARGTTCTQGTESITRDVESGCCARNAGQIECSEAKRNETKRNETKRNEKKAWSGEGKK